MRITPVINNIFKLRGDYKNNQYDYSQYRVPVLRNDTLSFTGHKNNNNYKFPIKIFHSNPFEDAKAGIIQASSIPKREILDYSRFLLPCPCCGDLMMPPQLMDKIKTQISNDSVDTINLLKNYKNFMHPIERGIFNILQIGSKKHPNMDFQQILRKKYSRAERQLILQQTSVLNDINLLSREIPEQYKEELNSIIQNTYSEIFNQKDVFSRKIFIGKIEDYVEKIKHADNNFSVNHKENPPAYYKTLNKIIEKAYTLPTSYNSIHAFIVKYSKNKYSHRSIAERILSGSVATIEHALPECLGGKTRPANLINECARDNHARRHDEIIKQIREYPEMPENMQKHFNKLIELSKQGKVDKSYICEIASTYYKLSKGLLNIDVSALWTKSKNKNAKNNDNKYSFEKRSGTPTKAERREQRKIKLKNRKTKQKNSTFTETGRNISKKIGKQVNRFFRK